MNKSKIYSEISPYHNKKFKIVIKSFSYKSLQYIIKNIEQINRGYQNIEQRLQNIGASIKKVD